MVISGLEFPWWIYPLFLWTILWKGIGMWKAGRNNQPYWFIALLVFNTVGILPIIYLTWFQEESRVIKIKKTLKKLKKKVSKKKLKQKK